MCLESLINIAIPGRVSPAVAGPQKDTSYGKPGARCFLFRFYKCEIFLLGFPGRELSRNNTPVLLVTWRVSWHILDQTKKTRTSYLYESSQWSMLQHGLFSDKWCNASELFIQWPLSRNMKFLPVKGNKTCLKNFSNFSKNCTKEENKVHLK